MLVSWCQHVERKLSVAGRCQVLSQGYREKLPCTPSCVNRATLGILRRSVLCARVLVTYTLVLLAVHVHIPRSLQDPAERVLGEMMAACSASGRVSPSDQLGRLCGLQAPAVCSSTLGFPSQSSSRNFLLFGLGIRNLCSPHCSLPLLLWSTCSRTAQVMRCLGVHFVCQRLSMNIWMWGLG